jgi:translation elongation factor EF-Ts
MACRDALEASGGDYEKAKTAVMSKLKNRDGKVMAEGLVALYADADSVGCVEIACETDFVARGASMARLSASAASVAAGSPSVGEELLARVREAVKAEMTEAARATGSKRMAFVCFVSLVHVVRRAAGRASSMEDVPEARTVRRQLLTRTIRTGF